MAGGECGGRSLEETPTWSVAAVCFVLVLISLIIEHLLHLLGKWLTNHHKRALFEALEKIKAELMLLGFISLFLTVIQGPIANICVSQDVGNSWHPCDNSQEASKKSDGHREVSFDHDTSERKLMQSPYAVFRRVLAGGGGNDVCLSKGQVSMISENGIHQLHIFIFVLAVFHVLYCITTLGLGTLKMRTWKSWEQETKTTEYQYSHDPERFRFARETSFGRRHLNFWSKSPILLWIVCFFRQFVMSVPKVDYLTLRHGFIMAHLAPQSSTKFDFRKYIQRSLEEDFKVVVGINPIIWFFAVIFILFNTHGSYSYLWLPFIPLIIILLVGTKLQVIITRMATQIMERGDVVRGIPVVHPTNDHFWFHRPELMLYLIHFVLFQNAFQLAFFVWSWLEFGFDTCFHRKTEDKVIRISMGILIHILCSYVTLPLYALVTQMGTNMKSTIFNERVANALMKWHHQARKHIKENTKSGSATPYSSRPATPTHGQSPMHLLRHYRSELDSPQTSPRFNNFDHNRFEVDGGSISSSHQTTEGSSSHHQKVGEQQMERGTELQEVFDSSLPRPNEHKINISTDFSFDKRQRK